MNTRRRSTYFVSTVMLLLAGLTSLPTFSVAQDGNAKPSGITIASLAGPWQIAIFGNTGCGETSMMFTGTLSSSGQAVGTLSGNSFACGPSSGTQTFTIESLNTNGSGTAGLTCGVGCGWTFNIQVSPNKQVFNLVDIVDVAGNNLAGTAVKQ